MFYFEWLLAGLFTFFTIGVFAQNQSMTCDVAPFINVTAQGVLPAYTAVNTADGPFEVAADRCDNQYGTVQYFRFSGKDAPITLSYRNFVSSDDCRTPDFGYEIRNACDGTPLVCRLLPFQSEFGAVELLNGADFDLGVDYVIRWYGSRNLANVTYTLEFALVEPIINDFINDAVDVAISTESLALTSFSTAGSTLAATAACGPSPTVEGDIWYSFVGTGTELVLQADGVTYPAGFSSTQFEIIEASSNTNIGCREVFSGSTRSSLLEGRRFLDNRSYLLRIYNLDPGTAVTGQFALVEKRRNGECENATYLPVNQELPAVSKVVNTLGLSSFAESCTGAAFTDGNWFEFVGSGEKVDLEVQNYPTVTILRYGVYEECGGALIECGSLRTQGDGTGVVTLNQGEAFQDRQRYVIRLQASGIVPVAYDVTLKQRPPNDFCEDAIDISVNLDGSCPDEMTTTNVFAVSERSFRPEVPCQDYPGGGTYYRFTATGGATNFIVTASDWDQTQAIIYTDDCQAYNGVTCLSVTGTGSTPITGLTAGATYLLRVFDAGNDDFGRMTFYLDASAALPAELTEFNAEAAGAVNTVYWETGSEVGVSNFLVEATPHLGGGDWSVIGSLPARGAANTTATYSATDPVPSTRTYYRLATVDLDGTTVHSRIVTVLRGEDYVFSGATATPNPTDGLTWVQFDPVAGDLNLSVYNAQGQQVLISTVSGATGRVPVDLENLRPGVYSVRLEYDAARVTLRVVVF